MTYQTEAERAGGQPVSFVEMDVDLCARYHPVGVAVDAPSDTIAGLNEQMCLRTEYWDDGVYWTLQSATADEHTGSETPPSGSDKLFDLTDSNIIGTAAIYQSIPAARWTTNQQYVVFCKVKYDSSPTFSIRLYEFPAGPTQLQIDFQFAAGAWSVKANDVGTGGVTSLGGGWWLLYGVVPAGVIDGTKTHYVYLCPSEWGVLPGSVVNTFATAAMVHEGATPLEYQYEDLRDGSRTNIRLTTGGLTVDGQIGFSSVIDGTRYSIEDNGAGYVRVTGDATGHGTGATIYTEDVCAATESEPCFKTRATCQDATRYNGGGSNILTCRFCQARGNVLPSAGAIPSVLAHTTAPAKITRARGIGPREKVTVTFQDHPHHDRGYDPYESLRSYDPFEQGTFWGKWRARNLYYQGRPLRLLTGYITEPLDLVNNFVTRNYVIESVVGPDVNGVAQVVAKDILKLADNKRAQVPVASEGVLSATLAQGANSLTLSPTGIGGDYPSSGTVRIDEEVMTYSGKSGDQLTGLGRGSDYTDDAEHEADASVQLCKRYTNQTIDDVVYDLLVNYAGVPAAYIDTSAWETEVDDWLAGHDATTLLTEPTGVLQLLTEITEQYLCDIWWDNEDQEIRLQVLKPAFGTYDTLNETEHFAANSFRVTDRPGERNTEVWIYYARRDPTEKLDETRNYGTVYVRADTDAEGAAQYGDVRVKKIFSRWITQSGDVLRLGARLLNATRDIPRLYTFTLDAKDDYDLGDIVALDSSALQDETGASVETRVYILSRSEPTPAHQVRIEATEDAFLERYARIGPDTMNDYDSATDAEKRDYGYIAEDAAPQLNGDGPYRVV